MLLKDTASRFSDCEIIYEIWTRQIQFQLFTIIIKLSITVSNPLQRLLMIFRLHFRNGNWTVYFGELHYYLFCKLLYFIFNLHVGYDRNSWFISIILFNLSTAFYLLYFILFDIATVYRPSLTYKPLGWANL